MNLFFKKLTPYLVLALLLIPAMLPLTTPGFFPIHDDEQVGRLYQLDKSLTAGHVPPRLTPDLGYGYNYLLFNFYPPFVYYVGEVFHLVGFSYITSIELMIASGFLLAAFFMYLFTKELVGKVGGVVAAIAYSYVPYHALDVYIRGALPEFYSFVFIPALFWSVYKLHKTNKNTYLILTAIFVAAQVMTHNLITMMSAIFLGPYFLFLIGKSNRRKLLLGKILLSVFVGLMLSAFFWIPSFFEKNQTMVDLLTSELADYNLHFVYIRQFWNSPWGYGGSLYGLEDGISFEIGKAHILLAILSGIGASFVMFKTKKFFLTGILFSGLFLISVYIQTFHSKLVWDLIPQFAYIQFPWRFLLFTAFSISFLIAVIFKYIKNEKLSLALGIVCICVLIGYNTNYFQPSQYRKDVTDKDYTSDNIIKWTTSRMAAEYVPKGIATRKTDANYTVVDITEDEISQGEYVVISGQLQVEQTHTAPHIKSFNINAAEDSVFQINSYAYPGWDVKIDGEKVNFSDNNKFKLIRVQIPQGKHALTATFEKTQIRQIADITSLLTFVAMTGYIVKYTQHNKKRKK